MEWVTVAYTTAVVVPALANIMTVRDAYYAACDLWYGKREKIKVVTVVAEDVEDDYTMVDLDVEERYERV